MKNIFLIVGFAWFFSCNQKLETLPDNIFENLSFSIDTVIVDSGEDFLNLGSGVFPYGLSQDLSRIYFFEYKPFKLVEVNLNQLQLIKKTDFEAEGPNGVGDYLSGLEVGPRGKVYLTSNSAVGIFDQSGIKQENLRFSPSGIDSALSQSFQSLFFRSSFNFEKRKIYSHPGFPDAGDHLLLIINPDSKSAKSLPLPKMKIVEKYTGTFTFEEDKGSIIAYYSVRSFLSRLPKAIIISSAAMSGFYRLNIETEKLEFVDIQHQTVPNEIKIEIPQNVSSPEEVRNIQNEIFSNVNFQEILWDESRQIYFRLGERTFRGETYQDPMRFEYYLFAYDQNFNVLGEAKLKVKDLKIKSPFFKDGKLWSYVNVEDELGFVVMDFKF